MTMAMATSTARAPDDPSAEAGLRLRTMATTEAAYAVPDYLAEECQRKLRAAASGRLASGDDDRLSAAWREKIVEWAFAAADHFDFDRETAGVALSFLDRYLAVRAVDRRSFQLAAMTALYLAAKLAQPSDAKLGLASLVELSREAFVADDVVKMEVELLACLGWRVHPPTPAAFLADLLPLAADLLPPADRFRAAELALFLTELTACDYWFVTHAASSVALAAVLHALEVLHEFHAPRRRAAFLRSVVGAGLAVDAAEGSAAARCLQRLREVYAAGGYASMFEEAEDARVSTVSPTDIIDGPEAESGMECA